MSSSAKADDPVITGRALALCWRGLTGFTYSLADWAAPSNIGVTNDLVRRVYEHRMGLAEGFTKKYRVHRLVYFESYGDVENAIHREKQLKKWNRRGRSASSRSTTQTGMISIQKLRCLEAPSAIRPRKRSPRNCKRSSYLSKSGEYWVLRLRGGRQQRGWRTTIERGALAHNTPGIQRFTCAQ